MRVLNIPGGQDTGGNGWRAYEAFRAFRPDWTYDLRVSKKTYIGYPVPEPWDLDEARQLWAKADVVHLRNNWAIEDKLGGVPGRPAVMHHHGTFYRSLHESLLYEAKRRHALTVCATLDLWLIHPDDTEWLPSLFDLDWLATFRRPPADDGVLRIAHAPTDRRVKSTAAFLRAVERLREHVPVELELIEGASWGECLTRKGGADIYFDQVMLGYGNNSIEAMAMGIPVIAGAADATLDEYQSRFGQIPFYAADEGGIYSALLALTDPAERELWAKRGAEHVRQWHDRRKVVDQMVDLYTRAVDAW